MEDLKGHVTVNAKTNSQTQSTPENISTKICIITSIFLKRTYKYFFKQNSNKIKTLIHLFL